MMLQSFSRIHALAFLCGFLSLCMEMFWIRYVGFIRQGDPYTFSVVLSSFLLGVAGGAEYGKRLCKKSSNENHLLNRSAYWLLAAAIYCPLSVGIYAAGLDPTFRDLILAVLIAASAFCFSVMFPVVHHLGVPKKEASAHESQKVSNIGKHFSGVYCSNVAGATLGPLFVGYVLLTWLSLEHTLYVISLLTCASALFYLNSTKSIARLVMVGIVPILVIVSLMGTTQRDWLIRRVISNPELSQMKIFETRQGIITVHEHGKSGDVVMGGNIYDGTTNLNLKINSNGLHRPLLMMALHDRPRRILMVGLSIGSWLALVREFPGVEHIDVVEINPGYLEAMKDYPLQRASLSDPRVKVHIHDARRWLKLHPDERYDVIFMNTTFHWRNNSSLLLSQQFLELTKSKMNPGAVLAFNATGSIDALRTAAEVFSHARRYANFVYAADWDFDNKITSPLAFEKFTQFEMNGEKVINEAMAKDFLSIPIVTPESAAQLQGRPAEVITDQNMINEYKFGRR